MAADIQAAIAKLNAKNTQGACSACGRNNWTSPDRVALIQAGADMGGSLNIGEGMDVLPVICTNCGLIRFHAVAVL